MDSSSNPLVGGAHRRSLFRGIIGDLKQLAAFDDELQSAVVNAPSASHFWSNSQHSLAVNRALFQRDMRIQLTLHPQRLVPTLLSRLNYILSIQDLVLSCVTSGASWGSPGVLSASLHGCQHSMQHRVVDIGTGYGAALALLTYKETGWGAVATDIDDVNLAGAVRNVAANASPTAIQVVDARTGHVQPPAHGTEEGSKAASSNNARDNVDVPILLPALSWAQARGSLSDTSSGQHDVSSPLLATLCNPPFFASEAEARSSSEGYKRSACTGSQVELVYAPRGGDEGGEVAFVARMIRESSQPNARTACIWYTSMLGKNSSKDALLPLLSSLGVPHVRSGELYQGRTARWWIAWSWMAPQQVCRHEAWQYIFCQDTSSKPPARTSGAEAQVDASGHEQGPRSKRRKIEFDPCVGGKASVADTPTQGVSHAGLPPGMHGSSAVGPSPGQPQRSAEKQRACRAFLVHLDTDKPPAQNAARPLEAYAITAACRSSYYAVPSAADCAHIREVQQSSEGSQAHMAGAVSLSDLVQRIEQALTGMASHSHPVQHKYWALHSAPSAETAGEREAAQFHVTDVLLRHPSTGLQDYSCVCAWAGVAESTSAIVHWYEVQVLVDPSATAADKPQPSAVVVLCLLGPVAADWQAFERFSDRLQQDVYRTSRVWRRLLRPGTGPASAHE